MRIIVIGARELVPVLAAFLHLVPVDRAMLAMPAGFVLDGTDLRAVGARALDLALRAAAAEVDAVVWRGGGDPTVLDHYRGRVVDLTGEPDLFHGALDGLREVVLSR